MEKAEDSINIKVYSNCQEVTLYVNGEEKVSQVKYDRVFIFESISLQKGLNVFKAVSSLEDFVYDDLVTNARLE
ncbi:DUF4982 domain-containing protein [Neobacillus niacini]|uniref:DUF4982 domain-containing protein n=1 Tax=Neobacillus niacini TaxID=86668 RepID=UPI002FFF8332